MVVWAGFQNYATTLTKTNGQQQSRHTCRLFIAASQWTTWLQWGLCHLCYSDSAVTITTYSDTKCKVQLPSKSLPIIKGPWVAVLPPLQLLSDYWVWGELRRQSAAKRRGPRGLGKNQIQNTAKNKLKEDFWTAITGHPARPLLQHSRAAVISDRKGY